MKSGEWLVSQQAIRACHFILLPLLIACNMEKKTGSLLELMQVPSVIMISLVVVVISNIWGFLDPTLEPHLREVSISGKS